VAGTVLLTGLTWVALQPAQYRVSASVLMSAPVALDAEAAQADIQAVAIQRRILLGERVIAGTLDRFNAGSGQSLGRPELAGMLDVTPLPDTNLVEMSAQGPQAEHLPLLVNDWIDVYLELRAEEVSASKALTEQRVDGEMRGLDRKLAEARSALASYREQHSIVSAERQENEILSRLEGLNTSLNTAREEEVKARAHLQTLEEAIRNGERVVPGDEQRALERLETELQTLRGEMSALERRYTDQYIDRQPQYRAIRERIAALAQEVAAAYADGQATEIADARQAYAAARQTVRELDQQLSEQQRVASEFSGVFATYRSLVADLERLEEMYREWQARIVQVELRDVEKYPPVDVVDRPPAEAERIGPDYVLLIGGVLLAALAAGIGAVWLYAFLAPKRETPAYVTLSGVHLYPGETGGGITYQGSQQPRLPPEQRERLLTEASDSVDDPPKAREE
jgi:uncharacterized protein involved in exopolysaccharide biosynthesis